MRRLLLPLLFFAAPAHAGLSERDLAGAVARPPAGAVLPAALRFTDQRGAITTLGAAADGKPLVLLFVDYTCAHICGPGLTLTAGALHDSGLVAGRDYAMAIVGIDPADGIAAARAMARARLGGLPDVARTTRLLVGDPATITAATGRLGYGYVKDPATDQYAHDASVYIFAPDGHLASLLPELALRPETVRAAISNAAATTATPSFAERVAYLCYGLGAVHGVYGRAVVIALQGLAILLSAGLGAVLWRWRGRAG